MQGNRRKQEVDAAPGLHIAWKSLDWENHLAFIHGII
jgi:hypothetical protein